jgi:hypothetical protein
MFGNSPLSHEGYIRADGSFTLEVQDGHRHVIVVGKDAMPLKVIAVNVVEGPVADLGIVDVTGNCPSSAK